MRQSDRFKEKDFKKRSNFRYRQLEKSDTLRYLLWGTFMYSKIRGRRSSTSNSVPSTFCDSEIVKIKLKVFMI